MSTPTFNAIYRRIQLATNTRTQSELAKILGVHQPSISDAKRRNVIPARWCMLLNEKFGLSQDWLLYGINPMYARAKQGDTPLTSPATAARADAAPDNDPAARSTLVKVYSMHCKPDRKCVLSELDVVGSLAIPSSLAGPDMLVVLMCSNNMAPTVLKGAYLGVDTADTRPQSSSLCVLKHDHAGLLVRRIFLDYGSNRYHLRSDADTYPESIITAEEWAERLVGRVRWVIQEIV